MARDLLKHVPSTADPGPDASPDQVKALRRDREHVNVTLNDELERYAAAHGVDLSKQVKVGAGFIYGTDPCVWFLPGDREIGGGSRAGAELYLKEGVKDGGQ